MNQIFARDEKKITTKVSSGIQNKVSAGEAKPDFTHRNHVVAYIDGSYNKGTNTVGSGGVIFLNGTRKTFSFPSTDERYTAFGMCLAKLWLRCML